MRSLANVGACGVGKSQIVSQVANDLDCDFLHVRAVQLDPVDLRGLPRIAADQTEWVPPKFLPTAGKGTHFLDELTSAPQMTQAGCYQLVLDRKLGDIRCPMIGSPSPRGLHRAGVELWLLHGRILAGDCMWSNGGVLGDACQPCRHPHHAGPDPEAKR